MSRDPTIVIRNSYCTLKDFPLEVLASVRNSLTYKDESVESQKIQVLRNLKYAHQSKRSGLSFYMQKKLAETGGTIDGYISQLKAQLYRLEANETVCLLLDDNRFPTGLVNIVRTVLKDTTTWNHKLLDLRERPEPSHRFKWKVEPHEPRYYQKEMIDISEVSERGVFESCVGSGKTLVMTYIIKEKRLTTLVVLPSLPLISQTLSFFEKALGKSNLEVLTTAAVKGGKKLKPIRLVTVQTLASLLEQGLLERATGDVDLLILDEFHHAASASYTNLLPMIEHIYYRYGFTGTFLRNDSKTLDLWGVLSNRLYFYPPYKAIEEGFITPIEFQVHKLQGINKLNYQKEYEENYCGSESLLQEIATIVRSIPEDDQILVLVDRKEASGEVIHKYLNFLGIDNTYISGDDKKATIKEAIEDFNEHKVRVLIGSTVIGEGVDVHSTKHLILATGGKSEIKIVQAIGRGVRLHPGKDRAYVYDFLFQGTKFLEKHLEERLSIYENQFAGEIKYVA